MQRICTAEEIVAILHEKVGVPVGMPNIIHANWEELGVESLALTEVLSNLEQTLNISIPQEDGMSTNSILDLVTMINTKFLKGA